MYRSIFVAATLTFALLFGQNLAAKPPGSGTGGFGELGNGCVTFENAASPGTFHDDGNGAYCNGTDGQVSVPKRFRLDTKKFNSNNRVYLLDAICSANSPACNGTVDIEVLQTQLRHEWNGGQLVATGELDFQSMADGEIARVSSGVGIDRDTGLKFGNASDERVHCPAPSEAAPLWVQCLDDKDGDGFCDLWTLTTANLEGTAEPDARGCLMNTRNGTMLDEEVTADFSLAICVLGVSCP